MKNGTTKELATTVISMEHLNNWRSSSEKNNGNYRKLMRIELLLNLNCSCKSGMCGMHCPNRTRHEESIQMQFDRCNAVLCRFCHVCVCIRAFFFSLLLLLLFVKQFAWKRVLMRFISFLLFLEQFMGDIHHTSYKVISNRMNVHRPYEGIYIQHTYTFNDI